MIKDLISLALSSIRRRKLRSWLSILGICIGISAIVALVSLSYGLRDTIEEQFQKIGTDKMLVRNGGAFQPPGALQNKLTLHDLNVVKDTKGVETATGLITRFTNIKFNEKTATLILIGVSLEKEEFELIEEIESLEIGAGRTLKKGDRNKLLIGYGLSSEEAFFSKKVKLRDKIEIESSNFDVVGIIKKFGSSFEDSRIFLPINILEEIIGSKNEYDMIFVRTQKGFTPDQSAENIKEDMRKDRELKEGNEDFSVQTFESITNTFNTIFSTIQAVVLGIVSISLLVGGIGIMNTMYTSVLERTKDIGVMKSVGAKNWHILVIFLFESGILGLIGGVIGIIIGFLLSKTAEIIAVSSGSTLVKTSLSFSVIIGVMLFSVIVGIISGILPAYQASKLKPVDALRYE